MDSRNYVVWMTTLVVRFGRDKQAVGAYGSLFQISSAVVKVLGASSVQAGGCREEVADRRLNRVWCCTAARCRVGGAYVDGRSPTGVLASSIAICGVLNIVLLFVVGEWSPSSRLFPPATMSLIAMMVMAMMVIVMVIVMMWMMPQAMTVQWVSCGAARGLCKPSRGPRPSACS